ncbi:glycine/sarcosine/betaine reductase complex protein A [Clostridium carboxidivorans P7]|uniref:Sarcosine reductase n=2 Tax=Clostridium TaxID=1485 RepID=C6PSB5_9CLOT|nr:glycine/sarcosine/betaine reductase complex protein A [Clostridium carboxidivorans P7]EET87912.1 Sarcosine reductase [Clostridium carboxidivorans P7]EFG89244.1 glycine/sarcosine/betaine reductase complex protein A [Clostridium carboxidivorans P7]
MDLEIQQRVKDLTEKHGAENVVVVIGGAEAEASGLSAETVSAGDPTFAGPLAGVELGLAVYHMVEPEIKDECDAAVYDEQCGMMEMVLDVDAIIGEVKTIREQYSKF